MNNAPSFFYNNETCAEHLALYDAPMFSEEQIATFCAEAAQVVRQNQAYVTAHPCVGIYRIATEGSQTRRGGTIQTTRSPWQFKLPNGLELRAAHKGDLVAYPDGSTAQIVTGAGHGNSDQNLQPRNTSTHSVSPMTRGESVGDEGTCVSDVCACAKL